MSIPYPQLRVLIVEDHAFTRLLIKEVLQSLGCQQGNIHEAEDGSAGLKALLEKRADLIICDWQMQPMDGLTFVRTLRDPAKSKNPFVPIIFCTAHTDLDLIQRARDTGVTEVMTKPITVKAIEGKIKAILEAPRPFVDSSQYFGPDRRRRSEEPAPPEERRRARRTVIKQVSEDQPIKVSGASDDSAEAGDGTTKPGGS
jgi:two-component system, chemotaxis family, chemotaxis protein CheY